MSEHSIGDWRRLVRPADFVWLAIFAVLVATALQYPYQYPDGYSPGPFEYIPLIALGIAQILEPKIPASPSKASRIFWFLLKTILGWVLVGYTGSLNSNYWPVILLPILSAATAFGLVGSLALTALAIGWYLSFLLHPESHFTSSLSTRVALIALVGHLVNTLAQDLRVQSEKNRRTAEQLAQANLQLREAEEAVRRSDRLAALGQLSAGLAHELRNPLGTMRASAEMLLRNVAAENEVAREVAGFIASEVDRTNSLITRFLQFARPLELRRDTADLSQTIDRAVAQVERDAKGGVAIYKNYAPEIGPFAFDSELMERVFYNLIINAVQASAPGGAVTVKTRAAAGTVEIAVIDRGTGIDPQQRNSIFNPFFTTKSEGVGLGLAIVSKIVDEHGGNITVESEPGKGSVFHVLLPRTVEAASPTADPA